MTEVEEIIDKVRRRVYARYRTHTEVDDLMQEASIHVWKKFQECPDWDVPRIVYHGLMKAQSLVSNKSGEAPTGKPKNLAARRKQVNGETSREKITNYLAEYTKLHGKAPSNVQAARELGMSTTNYRFHKDRLHLFDGAVDKQTAKVYSLDAGLDASGAGNDTPAWVYHIPPVFVDYELYATRAEVRDAIARLPERDRDYLFMEFWQDKTYVDIAKAMKVGGAYVNKYRKQVLARLREELIT